MKKGDKKLAVTNLWPSDQTKPEPTKEDIEYVIWFFRYLIKRGDLELLKAIAIAILAE